MARIEINTNGVTPLADTGTGFPGTVTGNERAKLQGVEAGAQVNLLNDVNVVYPSGQAAAKTFVGKVITATLRVATASLDGVMSTALFNQLAQATADNASQATTIGNLQAAVAALQSTVNLLGQWAQQTLNTEIGIGSTGMQPILTWPSPVDATAWHLGGQITFRNSHATASGIGYFRLVDATIGLVLASGQMEVGPAGQRETVGFSGFTPAATPLGHSYQLQAMSSLGGGVMLVTNVNGKADGNATQFWARWAK